LSTPQPSELTPSNRIKRLDNRLANQIAAGEVVERPASVVKELLENSIDADANKIEVDIERGGTRLIRVTDDGRGIVKEDLSLALSRHATSKISTSDDLAAIYSLGFRGEALASIGSVSRLCLTSRTKDSEYAWQAIAEGRDMKVDVQPASAIVGTRIEVRDLFYNTPARQKFLRAEKTEFGHIEEVFKRHALANFETAFILKHNNKIIKRVPAGRDRKDYIRRIESICGKPFAENSIAFQCEHQGISIQGWLGKPDFHRSESDIQYVFINARPVKDKMLNHAIRQSYQGLLPPGRMATFVIFLQIDPAKIDVNVHPTKHEVRFDEQRLVHDLLVKSVSEALNEEGNLGFVQTNNELDNDNLSPLDYSLSRSTRNTTSGVGYSQVSYQTKPRSDSFSDGSENHRDLNQTTLNPTAFDSKSLNERSSLYAVAPSKASTAPQMELTSNKLRLENGVWIVLESQSAFAVDEQALLFNYLSELVYLEKEPDEKFKLSKPLLFPQKIELDVANLEAFETLNTLQKLGFVFEPVDEESILLKQIPSLLASIDKHIITENFPAWVEVFSEGNFDVAVKKIYQTLELLSQEMFNYLVVQSRPLESNSAVKKITAGVAANLFALDN